MKPRVKTALIVLLALTTVIATGLAIQRGYALAALRLAASDDDQLDRASLERRLAEAEQRARALQAELAALNAHNSASEGDEPPPPSANGEGPGRPEGAFRRGGRGGAAMTALMESPEFAKLARLRQLGQLDSRYSSLFKNLVSSGKVSPQQLESLKDLLVEQQNTMRDVMMTARQQGITDRSQIDTLVKTAQSEIDSQILSTLGADAYTQYQQYTQTASQRQVVSRIEENLSYSSTPLSTEQSEKLVQALYAASGTTTQDGPPDGGGGPGGGPGGSVRITDEMIAAAQNVLTAAQMKAVTALQQQQQAERAMMQMMRNNRPSTSTATKSK